MSSPVAAGPSGRRLPRIHPVTDDAVLAREGWVDVAAAVLEAGGPDVALHLRGRSTGPRTLLALADRLAQVARRAGAALLVNDRVDVALVADVDGVHLGGGSLPAERARSLVGGDVWIGVSHHGADGAASAAEEGADYVFVGTIHPTASHPGVDGMGPVGLAEAVRLAGTLPVIGIGGIGPAEVEPVLAAGAYGVAAIRGIWDAPDPEAAVRRYLEGFGDQED